MNIFWLDIDLTLCARYHVDKHIVKMPLETAQLLCTTINLHGGTSPYKSTHINHPCRLWLEENSENFRILGTLGIQLCREYSFRYNKSHKCEQIIEYCLNNIPKDLPESCCPSKPPLCMPDEFKCDNVVQSYRNYYMGNKRDLASWKNRDTPSWWR